MRDLVTEKSEAQGLLSNSSANGLHILADFYDCVSEDSILTDAQLLETKCRDAVLQSELNEINYLFYQFPNSGVTGVILLAESHFAIHTWPEKSYITLDIFVCNVYSDNTAKARKLYARALDIFKPGRVNLREVDRE